LEKKIIAMHPLFFETRVLFGMTRFSNVASGKACDFFSTCKIEFCQTIAAAMDIGESTCHLFFALSSPPMRKKKFQDTFNHFLLFSKISLPNQLQNFR